MIDVDLLKFLKYYCTLFQNDWKLTESIKIYTIGNPGWRLKVCLQGTKFAYKEFRKISFDNTENDWLRCYIENTIFEGAGGPFNFPDMFYIFIDWINNDSKEKELNLLKSPIDLSMDIDNFSWLLKWYGNHCDCVWENDNMIEINAIDPGWYLTISVNETELENIKFNELNIDRTNDNWVNCFIKDKEFIGLGGPFNIIEIIHIFCNWAKQYSEYPLKFYDIKILSKNTKSLLKYHE